MRVFASVWVSLGIFVATIGTLSQTTAAQSATGCNETGPGADATAPCFAGNPDILGGRTSLLRDDDLIVNSAQYYNGTQGVSVGLNMLTKNSTFASQTFTSTTGDTLITNALTLSGRLFSVDHDQVLSAATIQPQSGQPTPLIALEGTLDSNITLPSPSLLTIFPGAQRIYGAAADFLGNGFDQMVLLGLQSNHFGVQALAAYDPLATADGVIVGQETDFGGTNPYLAVTGGVFTDPSANTPRPPAQLAVLTQGFNSLVVNFFSVSNDLNTITDLQKIVLSLPQGAATQPHPIAIAAGRFDGGTHDQLAIAYPITTGTTTTVEITIVDFNQGVPVQGPTTSTGFQMSTAANVQYPPQIYLAKGKFNWFGNSDQLGISVGTNGAKGSSIGVMSFDSSGNGTLGSPFIAVAPACHFGLAAGRYDNTTPNPIPTDPPIVNPNLQLADVATSCLPFNQLNPIYANIYNVDPNTFAITVANTASGLSVAGPFPSFGEQAVSLVAGDEQARSLALGPPEKVSVTHTQPDTILAVPPMHVDWIQPSSTAPPEILNFSVYPSLFNTAYNFTTSGSQSVGQSGTTSYTTSTKETANEKVSYGALGNSVSVSASQAATQMHQNTVAKTYNTYSGASTAFTTQTAFDDILFDTLSQLNVYTYPVLGQCASGSSSSGGCTSPLYIQFSGPDNVFYIQAENGANAEWYQPVQEPGNIFSYPATVEQLTSEIAGGTQLTALSSTDTAWDPQAKGTASVNWQHGSSNGSTMGTTSTHSFDASVSVSASVSFDGFGASAGAGFDYNNSSSLSTLNQSTSTLGSSLGITLNTGVGNSAIQEAYDYQGQSIIYGQANPNVVQTDATPSTDLNGSGYIAVAHLADMMSEGAITSGVFWIQAYGQTPDLALNHPQRWGQKYIPETSTQEVQFYCPYGYTSGTSPTSPPTPCGPAPTSGPGSQGSANSAIPGQSFYQMKGLFITPGGTSNGPTITSTALGSQVNLRARVYNYSLATFPAGSTLQVQFYAQPWDPQGAQFMTGSNPDGFAPAVFIGNGTVENGGTAPPLPFCGGTPTGQSDPCTSSPGSTTNNWEYVDATWDTSQGGIAANTTWKFWVVAWVQNNGQLVSELPGHGLTSLPSGAAYNSIADVPIELYSNNLGLYNQVFAVNPAPVASPTASHQRTTPVAKQLTLGKISTRNNAPLQRDNPITILAPHLAAGDYIDSIATLYYDGDPAKGGKIFDSQRIPRALAGTPYVDTASFTPKTCGQHQIFVRALPIDGTAPIATATQTFKVTSDPIGTINQIISYVSAPSYPPRFRNAILSYLNAAKRSFTNKQMQAGTIQMQTLLNLVNGGAFFVPSDVQQALAAQMSDLLGCL